MPGKGTKVRTGWIYSEQHSTLGVAGKHTAKEAQVGGCLEWEAIDTGL